MQDFRNSSEMVLLVSEDKNEPIGEAPRKEMRSNNLCHRSSYVFVKT